MAERDRPHILVFEARFRGRLIQTGCRDCTKRDADLARRKSLTKHGLSDSPLMRVWIGMRSRCNNPKRKEYKNYGGRGIKVCDEWDDFAVFYSWARKNGWAKGLDIDRIDNDGDYSPENCRVVSRKENLRHTRHNRHLEAFGESKIMIEWSEDPRCPVSYRTLEARIRSGWEAERAISTPAVVGRPKMGP